MAKCTYTQAAARKKIERIVQMLVVPMNWNEVAENLHCHRQTASRYLWHLARQQTDQKCIYVYDWIEDETTLRKIPVFKAGRHSNKRKPPPLTDAEKFQRIMADPLRHERRRANTREHWHRTKGTTPPVRPVASPFAALGL